MVEKRNEIVRGAKGKRLVIVHAMTRAGWLRDPDLPRMKSKVEGKNKCCLGYGDKEDAWMELTSNAFYYCTPGCKSVAEELREQERTEEKKKLNSSVV